MKIEFLSSIIRIGDWIAKCTNESQLKNMTTFTEMLVTKQWFPNAKQQSIDEARDHLSKLIELQNQKITSKV
jgi:hypothetical protein